MQNTRKEEIVSYLEDLNQKFNKAVDCAPSLLGQVNKDWQVELETTKYKVSKNDVFVPLIGGFSTGKSTAINTLIGKKILPEKVSPETAIPAELRYSENEKIVALSESGEWSEHAITDLPDLSSRASQYQVVKVYVDDTFLKDIEPLVLVDMPGFDSGLDQHNQAILRYITSGALYLYMVNAKAGTVTRQDLRRIEEIIDLGRSVKVFLSMTDLASPEELQNTFDYVSDQMEFVIGETRLGKIKKDDVEDLKSELKNADISKLFDGLVLSSVRNLYFDANAHLNAAINGINSSASDLNERATQAKKSLDKVEREKEKMLKNLQEGELINKSELVIGKLEASLKKSVDELVTMARSGEAALSRGVADLVRSTLTVEIQRIVRQITSDAAYKFSGDIVIGGIPLSNGSDWVGDMVSIIETEAMNALTGFAGDAHSDMNKQKTVGSGGGIMGALSMVSLAIPHPVLKVIFAVLPGIIGSLFDAFRDKNETDKYREAIYSQVIPGVLSQVRPQVTNSLNDIEGKIIEAISSEVSAKVEAERDIYNEVTSSTEPELEELKKSLDTLKNIRTEMNSEAEKVIV